MKGDPARTAGDRTVKMNPSSENPLGEWNDYEIIVDGDELTLKINGVTQNEAAEAAVLPGYVGLQSEGMPCEFRRLRLIPLD